MNPYFYLTISGNVGLSAPQKFSNGRHQNWFDSGALKEPWSRVVNDCWKSDVSINFDIRWINCPKNYCNSIFHVPYLISKLIRKSSPKRKKKCLFWFIGRLHSKKVDAKEQIIGTTFVEFQRIWTCLMKTMEGSLTDTKHKCSLLIHKSISSSETIISRSSFKSDFLTTKK